MCLNGDDISYIIIIFQVFRNAGDRSLVTSLSSAFRPSGTFKSFLENSPPPLPPISPPLPPLPPTSPPLSNHPPPTETSVRSLLCSSSTQNADLSKFLKAPRQDKTPEPFLLETELAEPINTPVKDLKVSKPFEILDNTLFSPQSNEPESHSDFCLDNFIDQQIDGIAKTPEVVAQPVPNVKGNKTDIFETVDYFDIFGDATQGDSEEFKPTVLELCTQKGEAVSKIEEVETPGQSEIEEPNKSFANVWDNISDELLNDNLFEIAENVTVDDAETRLAKRRKIENLFRKPRFLHF